MSTGLTHLLYERHMFRCVALIVLLTLSLQVKGQDVYTWEQFTDDYVERLSHDEDISEEDIIVQLDFLEEMHYHPMDLNALSKEDLQNLFFLSEKQVSDILLYVEKNRPLFSVSELMLIPSLDFMTRQFLSLFLYVEPEKEKPLTWKKFVDGKHEIIARWDAPLYTREGYKNTSHLGNAQKYLGDKHYTSLRYRYTSQNDVRYGLSAEKDAGEPFACRGNSLYDSYSFYIFLKPRSERYTIALGDFKAHFGEGLTVGSGFMLGRSSYLYSTQHNTQTFRPHTSLSERDFFRGVAGKIGFWKMECSAFVSHTDEDATLKDGVITSVHTAGTHRTLSERAHKAVAGKWSAGADISYETRRLSFGLAFSATRFSHDLDPPQKVYNKYAMRGNSFQNISAHYRVGESDLSLQGEFAFSDGGGSAMIHSVRYQPRYDFEIIGVGRYYGVRYHAPHGYAFKAGSKVQNERGLYAGVKGRLSEKWSVRGYVDVYYQPWPTFSAPSPLRGQAFMGEVTFLLGRKDKISFQQDFSRKSYQGKVREKLIPKKAQMQLSADFFPGIWDIHTILKACAVDNTRLRSRGWLIGQRVGCKQRKTRIAALLSFFYTDDYASRLYLYEPDVIYAYSSGSVYYHGMRAALVGRVRFGKRWDASCKYGWTVYFNQKSIASGPQEIKSSSKSDLIFQLCCKL